MAERKLTVILAGDSRGLEQAIGSSSRKLDGFGSKFAGFGRAAALGAAGGVAALGVLGKSAVDAGSDLNETLSKSNTVFGDQAKAIETWAEGAAKGFGQSKKQALEAASSFGNMFSQLGIGDKQAGTMSKSMTELASDFASFHNADISEVLSAQEAAFRGEYDAVQKFVPTINAAAVEQKALAMGLGKTSKELDAQDKALATQALLLEGAGDAMGDFARTSDGLANKQRIMSARLEDVKAKIGQALIPAVTKLAELFLDKVLPAFEDVQAWVKTNWPQIQRTITDAVAKVKSVVIPIIEGLQTLWENFGDNILEFMRRVWPRIQQVIEGAMDIIQGVIKTVTSLIKGDWSEVWEGIKLIFSGVWEAIQGILGTALETLQLAIGAGLEVIGSVFSGAWEAIQTATQTAIRGIVDAFLGMAETIVGAAASAFSWVPGLGDKLKDAKEAIERFRDDVNRALGGIQDKTVSIKFVRSDFIGPLPEGIKRLPRGFIGPVQEAHSGGLVTASGIVPLRSDELLTKLQFGEMVLPKGTTRGGDTYYITVPPTTDEQMVSSLIRELRRNASLMGN